MKVMDKIVFVVDGTTQEEMIVIKQTIGADGNTNINVVSRPSFVTNNVEVATYWNAEANVGTTFPLGLKSNLEFVQIDADNYSLDVTSFLLDSTKKMTDLYSAI
jgi:hypothetical protein